MLNHLKNTTVFRFSQNINKTLPIISEVYKLKYKLHDISCHKIPIGSLMNNSYLCFENMRQASKVTSDYCTFYSHSLSSETYTLFENSRGILVDYDMSFTNHLNIFNSDEELSRVEYKISEMGDGISYISDNWF